MSNTVYLVDTAHSVEFHLNQCVALIEIAHNLDPDLEGEKIVPPYMVVRLVHTLRDVCPLFGQSEKHFYHPITKYLTLRSLFLLEPIYHWRYTYPWRFATSFQKADTQALLMQIRE